ncbi:MAG: phosphatidate cytidylyltransferase [Victivallaceae bacterium]|nr:phosphatidate cytidylyltransferase [Victivallaceae bacterium]
MFSLRLLSWVILVGLFVAAVLLKETGKYIWFVMLVAGAFGATAEILAMLGKTGRRGFEKAAALTAALTVALVFVFNGRYVFLPATLFIAGGWGCLLVSGKKTVILEKLVTSTGGLLLALLPVFFLAEIYCRGNPGADLTLGAKRLLYLVAVTKTGDTFAYLFGILSNKIITGGNHKIVPAISPKKSWEGTIGGLVFSVLVSYCLTYWLFNVGSWFIPLFAGMFLFFGGFAGDLAESALKRTCGVKDSGRILPGMGGVYDVLDSFIFNAPLFYFFISL